MIRISLIGLRIVSNLLTIITLMSIVIVSIVTRITECPNSDPAAGLPAFLGLAVGPFFCADGAMSTPLTSSQFTLQATYESHFVSGAILDAGGATLRVRRHGQVGRGPASAAAM